MQGWTPPQLRLRPGTWKDHTLITTIKSYSTRRRALEEKSLGWLLGWRLQAAPSSACNSPTIPGMAGVAFLAASVGLGVTGEGWVSGCEEKAAVRVTARLVHGSLPATAPASPGYQGYQHFSAWLLFVLALSPWLCWHSQFWGMCVIYALNVLAKEEFNPSLKDLQVYVLTAQTFFYNFFHFSYLRKLGLISLLHSFSRCV